MSDYKVFLYGLDFAGKTTILNFLKGEPNTDTEPSREFDVGSILINSVNFHLWDAPGQTSLRDLWLNELDKTKILMYVLETNDKSRFLEAKREFERVLYGPLVEKVPLVFCFHKMDLKKANDNFSFAEEVFDLNSIIDRDVVTLKTTIKMESSIEKIKDTLNKVIINIQPNLNLENSIKSIK